MGLTFGVPTVTFEAPPERLASRRLHLPAPPALKPENMLIWHYGHTADPVFMGVCTVPSPSDPLTFVCLDANGVGSFVDLLVWGVCDGVDLSHGNGVCI
jgi:putative lipase involved disintegration of autophagic bodies